MYVDITGLQKLMKPLLFAYSVYILTHYSVKPLNVKDKQSITMNLTVTTATKRQALTSFPGPREDSL